MNEDTAFPKTPNAGAEPLWHAWSADSLQEARDASKLILLHCGEALPAMDSQAAALAAQAFAPITLAPALHPSAAFPYHAALRLQDPQGSFPSLCVCLPDARPVHFTAGIPGGAWAQFLGTLHLLWLEHPERLVAQADAIAATLYEQCAPPDCTIPTPAPKPNRATASLAREAWSHLARRFPEQPPPTLLATLALTLQACPFHADEPWLAALAHQLRQATDHWLLGPTFDQVRGGFIDVSDPERPSKNLVENAQLACVLARVLRGSQSPLWRRALRHTVESVSQAFSPTLQRWPVQLSLGQCLTWSQGQVLDALSPYMLQHTDFDLEGFLAFFGFYREGNNSDGTSLPSVSIQLRQGLDDYALVARLQSFDEARQTLARASLPLAQDVMTSEMSVCGNALMAHALLDAGRIMGDQRTLSLALHVLDALHADTQASPPTDLHDLTALCAAFLAAHQTTLAERWLERATALASLTLECRADPGSPFFHSTPVGTGLPMRLLELRDIPYASPNARLAECLWALSLLGRDDAWRQRALQMALAMRERALEEPENHSAWLQLLMRVSRPAVQVTLCGPDWFRWASEAWKAAPWVTLVRGAEALAEPPTTIALVQLDAEPPTRHTALRPMLQQVLR